MFRDVLDTDCPDIWVNVVAKSALVFDPMAFGRGKLEAFDILRGGLIYLDFGVCNAVVKPAVSLAVGFGLSCSAGLGRCKSLAYTVLLDVYLPTPAGLDPFGGVCAFHKIPP